MRFFTIIALLLITFQVSGQKINNSQLLGCWLNSKEENTQGENLFIYRPCDYKKFPPSRFRFKFVLKSDLKCSWLVLAPNDGHFMEDGTWTFNEESNELKFYDLKGKIAFRFIITAFGDNILKIKN